MRLTLSSLIIGIVLVMIGFIYIVSYTGPLASSIEYGDGYIDSADAEKPSSSAVETIPLSENDQYPVEANSLSAVPESSDSGPIQITTDSDTSDNNEPIIQIEPSPDPILPPVSSPTGLDDITGASCPTGAACSTGISCPTESGCTTGTGCPTGAECTTGTDCLTEIECVTGASCPTGPSCVSYAGCSSGAGCPSASCPTGASCAGGSSCPTGGGSACPAGGSDDTLPSPSSSCGPGSSNNPPTPPTSSHSTVITVNPINDRYLEEDPQENLQAKTSDDNYPSQSHHEQSHREFNIHPGQSIQAVINEAKNGATINLEPGEYKESLVIDKWLTLQGIDPDEPAVINADGKEYGIKILADSVSLRMLKVINSNSDGILVCSNGNTINHNSLSNCGSGIHLVGSKDCTITYNSVSSNDIGIYLQDSSGNNIFRNILIDNKENDAYDDGNNKWDDGSHGNTYSILKDCKQSSHLGPCKSQYKIPGGASIDKYPLPSTKQ